jgi:hypothetical protein
MENIYKPVKVSWNCFRVANLSIGSSISTRGTAYCHFGGVTKMPPKKYSQHLVPKVQPAAARYLSPHP